MLDLASSHCTSKGFCPAFPRNKSQEQPAVHQHLRHTVVKGSVLLHRATENWSSSWPCTLCTWLASFPMKCQDCAYAGSWTERHVSTWSKMWTWQTLTTYTPSCSLPAVVSCTAMSQMRKQSLNGVRWMKQNFWDGFESRLKRGSNVHSRCCCLWTIRNVTATFLIFAAQGVRSDTFWPCLICHNRLLVNMWACSEL